MQYSIALLEKPVTEDVKAIAAPLQQFNLSSGPPTVFLPVALVVRDAEEKIIGGFWGKTCYDWMQIEYLVVPDSLRKQGIGTSLMQQAEAIARQRGCTGVYLDTLAFQARGFYEKLGYTVFGTLEDFPKGGAHYFLRKSLRQPEP